MAQYGVQYRMEFDDVLGAKWRIDLLQRGTVTSPAPLALRGTDEPLVLNKKNDDESRFAPFITTTAQITYMIEGDPVPEPDVFILIDEKEWMVNIYKNGILDFRGFIRPDNNSYPWRPIPFAYTINAVDFTFTKGVNIDLDSESLFLYDFIPLGDFLRRTLFTAIGYDDPILDILYTPLPEVTADNGDILTDGIYVHTDAFYEFDTGAKKIYDCLVQFLKSIGARIFYADGRYQIQRFQDIGTGPQQLIRITPEDTAGTIYINGNYQTVLSLNNFNGVMYYNNSATAKVNLTLKERTYNFDLKAINQIKNFDWRTSTQSPFANWEGDITGFYQRTGSGSVADPFRLIIGDVTPPTFRSIWSRIPVTIGKLFQVNVKTKSFLTLGSPSPNNFQVFLKVIAVLVEAGSITPIRYMDSGGDWQEITSGSVGENEYYHVSSDPLNDQFGTLDITSKPIPGVEGVSSMEILFIIVDSGINLPPPGGSSFYNELYPVFGRVFNNPYVKLVENIKSTADYSFIDDDDSRFFADTNDPGLSNTLFYNNGAAFVPLPAKNWNGQAIDEQVIRTELDQQHAPGFGVEGDFISNKLSFHQAIIAADKDNKIMMQLRDNYSVKSAVHSLALVEIMETGSGDGIYTVTPKTNR